DYRTVPHAVAVLQRAVEHVGHDLHIRVRMHGKSPSAGHAVVVHHPQRAKVHVLGIIVVGKGKREPRIQPSVVCMSALVALANLHHGPTSGSRVIENDAIISVITTSVNRHIERPPAFQPRGSLPLALPITFLHRRWAPFPATPPLV